MVQRFVRAGAYIEHIRGGLVAENGHDKLFELEHQLFLVIQRVYAYYHRQQQIHREGHNAEREAQYSLRRSADVVFHMRQYILPKVAYYLLRLGRKVYPVPYGGGPGREPRNIAIEPGGKRCYALRRLGDNQQQHRRYHRKNKQHTA